MNSGVERGMVSGRQARFDAIVDTSIDRLRSARMLRRVEDASVAMCHYHALLLTLFHQTREGPYTFALAAAKCPWRHATAREYLLVHANEERTHWQWVLDDLAATGHVGPDPRTLPAHPTTHAFIGLLHVTAERAPVARLAIASVLEGIGARLGSSHGGQLVAQLGLRRAQASFLLSHGTTDVAHTADLRAVIAGLDLGEEEWDEMDLAAEVAGRLYHAMYDHEGYA